MSVHQAPTNTAPCIIVASHVVCELVPGLFVLVNVALESLQKISSTTTLQHRMQEPATQKRTITDPQAKTRFALGQFYEELLTLTTCLRQTRLDIYK